MLIKMNSTRHTAVGTFKFGVIYNVDERDPRVAKALKGLRAGATPAATVLTEKQAKKLNAEVKSLAPLPAASFSAQDADVLQKELSATQATLEELQGTAGDLASKVAAQDAENIALTAAVAALSDERKQLEDDLAAMAAEADTLKSTLENERTAAVAKAESATTKKATSKT
ncbi:hypothetical protein AB9F26_05140 [Falsihalocynthiibacter sp. BN13B15]|uniref:hypothetical protein n=1 Tax=Falsihalocynthiibacter sp. BN13B15 TaxID=3240871 RepID=UPI00350EB0D1